MSGRLLVHLQRTVACLKTHLHNIKTRFSDCWSPRLNIWEKPVCGSAVYIQNKMSPSASFTFENGVYMACDGVLLNCSDENIVWRRMEVIRNSLCLLWFSTWWSRQFVVGDHTSGSTVVHAYAAGKPALAWPPRRWCNGLYPVTPPVAAIHCGRNFLFRMVAFSEWMELWAFTCMEK